MRHMVVDQTGLCGMEARLSRLEQFEIAFARHARRSQVVLNDEYGKRGIFWNHDGPCDTGLRKNHVIPFGAHTAEPIRFEILASFL